MKALKLWLAAHAVRIANGLLNSAQRSRGASAPAADQAGRAQPTGAPASVWFPLGADRLELGATGFAITIRTASFPDIYTLTDPEGHRIAWGAGLQHLKAYAEQLARDRGEFGAPINVNTRHMRGLPSARKPE